MAARTRTTGQALLDRTTAVELHLKGWTEIAIAAKLQVSPSQVRHDLRKVQDEWRTTAIYDFDLIKQRELHRINMLETEAWSAWEKSKVNREITTTRQSKRQVEPVQIGIGSTTTSATKRAEQRDPDARYLAVIQWCIAERAKLLGLYAPTEMKHSGLVRTVNEMVYEISPEGPVDGLTVIGSVRPALSSPRELDGVEILDPGESPFDLDRLDEMVNGDGDDAAEADADAERAS